MVGFGWQFPNFSLTRSNLSLRYSNFFYPTENPLVNFHSICQGIFGTIYVKFLCVAGAVKMLLGGFSVWD